MKAIISALCLVFTQQLLAQEELRILPEDFNADKEQQMMRAYLRRLYHEPLDRRLAELETLETPEQVAAYQARRREILANAFGPMPERTPLNAQVTGKLDGAGFTLEKVIYESRPGFFVTGNLYLPDGEGPHPGILHPCGHTDNGKAAEVYQKASILLAQHGFVVLCYDPIGQGERKQLLDARGKSLLRSSGEHGAVGVAPILLSRDLASYMLWDAVRGLDYLETRPEVDAKRLGCTGNSGGGNMTSYLMSYDDRIAAAAPGCFMATHRRKNESPGPGDAEQNLFGQIRDGFDHPDFILTRAPKPTLILSATHDFVPIAGTWEAFRQAKQIYGKLGFPERIQLVEANEKHGFSKPLREGATRFFARWLQDRHIEIVEPDKVATFAERDVLCTPDGQVSKLDGARSILDLNREYAQQLLAARSEVKADKVRKVTGIQPLNELSAPEVEKLGGGKLILKPEAGIVLPAQLWAGGDAEPVLICHDQGMPAAQEAAAELRKAGHPVMLVDLREIGETETRQWRFNGAEEFIAYMLGTSFLKMRAEDVLVCARFLAEQKGVKEVRVIAHGELGAAALHAAALEPGLISNLRLENGLKSWQSVLEIDLPRQQLPSVVRGAYAVYDLPDLIKLVGANRVEIVSPADGS